MTPKELKNSILQLAIEGKLVEQRKEEGSAETLYAEIQKEKQKLIKQGKIKKEKELPEITDDEILFEIPKSWKWVRLNQVVDVRDGTHDSPKYVKNGIPLITSKNLSENGIDYNNVKFISETDANNINKRSNVENGNILFAMIGSIGNPVIVDKKQNFSIKNVALFKVINNKLFCNKFLFYFLILTQYDMQKNSNGAVQQFVSLNMLRNYLFPLPPLAEQKRIVEKIEKLMPLVDRYEVLYDKLNALNKEFPKKLKNAVLQKAIEGKLVPQIKSEGSAEDLYAEIQKEKQKLIKQGKIKKEKELPEITDDEIPFEIPKSWKWCRVGDILNITMGQSPEGINISNNKKGMEFHQGKIFFDDIYLKESNLYTSEITKVANENSVLLCVRAPVGIVNITTRAICIGRGLCSIKSIIGIYEKLILYFLRTFEKDFCLKSTGTTFKAITNEVVKNKLFPLPPLAEQKRIVEKIEEILPNIEKLEKYD